VIIVLNLPWVKLKKDYSKIKRIFDFKKISFKDVALGFMQTYPRFKLHTVNAGSYGSVK